MTTAYEIAFGPYRPHGYEWMTEQVLSAYSALHGERGHYEWQTPEPCGPPSDPNRSHIYRAPRWVPDA